MEQRCARRAHRSRPRVDECVADRSVGGANGRCFGADDSDVDPRTHSVDVDDNTTQRTRHHRS
jgi:hypothetical protein